jgi:hypothetical protein
VSALLLLGACWGGVEAAAPPRCSMAPRFETLRLPEQGLAWLDGEELTGPCDEIPPDRWTRRPWNDADLVILPDGPEGSGLYYQVTLGIARKHDPQPHRGLCFSATAIGARTLGESARRALTFFEGPNPPTVSNLPWVHDFDADGQTELIVWNSFALVDDPAVYQFGLVAWVYRLQTAGTIAIDWPLSRRVASRIAAAYRTFARRQRENRAETAMSRIAGTALESFATGKCTAEARDAR